MKENMNTYIEKIKAKWNKRTKAQRNVLIGSCALIIILGISLLNKTKYVPLYSNLSLNEAGQIKTELDTRNIPYELSEDRKSTRLNSSHVAISYAVFCLKQKTK